MSNAGRLEKLTARYYDAAHKIQTAIAFDPDSSGSTPKHLRVGVDLSKSDMAGLARLLIEKKLFTHEEYLQAITESAEQEAETRAADLMAKYGINVTLV